MWSSNCTSQITTKSIKIRDSLAFLYSNNEKSESEIKEAIPFTTATKRIKYLGINLRKKTKELYMGNYKTLMKEIKDDINRWRDITCSWVERINILKKTILSNVRASLMAQTVKNLSAMLETRVQSLGWEDPWRREWQPTLVFLTGESHGLRSLAGYSSWSHKESDVTEHTNT